MSFEVFVALCLVGSWAMFPVSLMIASRSFDNEIICADDHHGEEEH